MWTSNVETKRESEEFKGREMIWFNLGLIIINSAGRYMSKISGRDFKCMVYWFILLGVQIIAILCMCVCVKLLILLNVDISHNQLDFILPLQIRVMAILGPFINITMTTISWIISLAIDLPCILLGAHPHHHHFLSLHLDSLIYISAGH